MANKGPGRNPWADVRGGRGPGRAHEYGAAHGPGARNRHAWPAERDERAPRARPEPGKGENPAKKPKGEKPAREDAIKGALLPEGMKSAGPKKRKGELEWSDPNGVLPDDVVSELVRESHKAHCQAMNAMLEAGESESDIVRTLYGRNGDPVHASYMATPAAKKAYDGVLHPKQSFANVDIVERNAVWTTKVTPHEVVFLLEQKLASGEGPIGELLAGLAELSREHRHVKSVREIEGLGLPPDLDLAKKQAKPWSEVRPEWLDPSQEVGTIKVLAAPLEDLKHRLELAERRAKTEGGNVRKKAAEYLVKTMSASEGVRSGQLLVHVHEELLKDNQALYQQSVKLKADGEKIAEQNMKLDRKLAEFDNLLAKENENVQTALAANGKQLDSAQKRAQQLERELVESKNACNELEAELFELKAKGEKGNSDRSDTSGSESPGSETDPEKDDSLDVMLNKAHRERDDKFTRQEAELSELRQAHIRLKEHRNVEIQKKAQQMVENNLVDSPLIFRENAISFKVEKDEYLALKRLALDRKGQLHVYDSVLEDYAQFRRRQQEQYNKEAEDMESTDIPQQLPKLSERLANIIAFPPSKEKSTVHLFRDKPTQP